MRAHFRLEWSIRVPLQRAVSRKKEIPRNTADAAARRRKCTMICRCSREARSGAADEYAVRDSDHFRRLSSLVIWENDRGLSSAVPQTEANGVLSGRYLYDLARSLPRGSQLRVFWQAILYYASAVQRKWIRNSTARHAIIQRECRRISTFLRSFQRSERYI